jgi:hypothetical protein
VFHELVKKGSASGAQTKSSTSAFSPKPPLASDAKFELTYVLPDEAERLVQGIVKLSEPTTHEPGMTTPNNLISGN